MDEHELPTRVDVIFMCSGCERVSLDGTCPLAEVTKSEQELRAKAGSCEDAIVNGIPAKRVRSGTLWVNKPISKKPTS